MGIGSGVDVDDSFRRARALPSATMAVFRSKTQDWGPHQGPADRRQGMVDPLVRDPGPARARRARRRATPPTNRSQRAQPRARPTGDHAARHASQAKEGHGMGPPLTLLKQAKALRASLGTALLEAGGATDHDWSTRYAPIPTARRAGAPRHLVGGSSPREPATASPQPESAVERRSAPRRFPPLRNSSRPDCHLVKPPNSSG